MKKLALFFFLMSCFGTFAQGSATIEKTFPESYFRKPLDIPLILSGTFAELRPHHFHAGIDIKTQQKEGLNVYAAAEGYVSRIKISHWGYGKAIYITHPNGYTTVYAHLKKFNKRIEAFIKKKQYKKESFEIQVFPSPEILPVKKGEIIAFTGSTGGFVGPHLHFEIRDTKSEKPINPMLFGITVSDSKRPRIKTLIGYPLDSTSSINQLGIPSKIAFRKLKNGNLLANKIVAHGTIGFGVQVYDQLDGAYNKNGIYKLKMLVNGKKVYDFRAYSFAFSESKYINLLIDYGYLEEKKQRIHKCFITPENKLSMYRSSANKGFVTIKDGLTYNVVIVSEDFKGNTLQITIPVIGKKEPVLVKKEVKRTAYKINHNQFYKFTDKHVTVAFPKNTFYQDFYLDFWVNDTIVQVHPPTIPLNKKYTLTFDVSKYDSIQKKYMYIASITDKGSTNYEPTVKKEHTFYTTTKKLGKFILRKDTIQPKIRLYNFKDKQWVTHFKTLKIKISDAESGIQKYRGEIDGKWILMEYNVKRGILTYNLSDKSFSNAKHQLKVTVTDNVGNTNTIYATFFRKK